MAFKGLAKCITDPVTETNKHGKALLALSVAPTLYVHISRCETTLEIWQKLKNLYEDKGLTRKIGLLRGLISCGLEDCENMQSYIDRVKDNSNKLNEIGFEINEDWLTAIVLAGLTDAYKPFIMGIEASDSKITSETIIAKLLDSDTNTTTKSEAFLSKKKYENKQKYSKIAQLVEKDMQGNVTTKKPTYKAAQQKTHSQRY